jgi:aminopeptidase C
MRTIKDKNTARIFSQVLRNLTVQTSKEKAVEVMQKDIIRRIHHFLLESHADAHPAVFEYYGLLAKESAARGVFNIEQAS